MREEIHSLKTCQLTYLSISITSTGLLFGLASSFTLSNIGIGLCFLFPLIIVLPSWQIFFDKARSISRAVGYCRIVERILVGKTYAKYYNGWENDLNRFRRKRQKFAEKKVWNVHHENHAYWVACYIIFFTLTIICLIFATHFQKSWFEVYFVRTLSAFSVAIGLYNFSVLNRFLKGDSSYNSNELIWWKVLAVKRIVGPKKPVINSETQSADKPAANKEVLEVAATDTGMRK